VLNFVAWKELQALGVQGLEGKAPQGQLVRLEPKKVVSAPIIFLGHNHDGFTACDG